MRYVSTKGSGPVDARTAVLQGLPSDNGLFVPEAIPKLPDGQIKEILQSNLSDIAYQVTHPYLSGEISDTELRKICAEAFNFPLELVNLEENLSVLELFHGPTLAFKDFGARFMARVMGFFVRNEEEDLHILVATSGDTGGAVGNGFHGVEGIRVTIVFPENKISKRQQAQITSLGGNVQAVAVQGTFDDCQKLVKEAFLDAQLKELRLSSANSINISRLIPQSIYYFAANAMLSGEDPLYVVPSGNLGNISAGVMALKMGLPIHQFIAALNANDTFERYLQSDHYEARPSVPTLANAMDVGNPSNIQRLMYWLSSDISNYISATHYNDEEILRGLKNSLQKYEYNMCPHTAIGYLAAMESKVHLDKPHVILSTAHPSKFSEELPEIPYTFELPQRLHEQISKVQHYERVGNHYQDFKDYLLS